MEPEPKRRKLVENTSYFKDWPAFDVLPDDIKKSILEKQTFLFFREELDLFLGSPRKTDLLLRTVAERKMIIAGDFLHFAWHRPDADPLWASNPPDKIQIWCMEDNDSDSSLTLEERARLRGLNWDIDKLEIARTFCIHPAALPAFRWLRGLYVSSLAIVAATTGLDILEFNETTFTEKLPAEYLSRFNYVDNIVSITTFFQSKEDAPIWKRFDDYVLFEQTKWLVYGPTVFRHEENSVYIRPLNEGLLFTMLILEKKIIWPNRNRNDWSSPQSTTRIRNVASDYLYHCVGIETPYFHRERIARTIIHHRHDGEYYKETPSSLPTSLFLDNDVFTSIYVNRSATRGYFLYIVWLEFRDKLQEILPTKVTHQHVIHAYETIAIHRLCELFDETILRSFCKRVGISNVLVNGSFAKIDHLLELAFRQLRIRFESTRDTIVDLHDAEYRYSHSVSLNIDVPRHFITLNIRGDCDCVMLIYSNWSNASTIVQNSKTFANSPSKILQTYDTGRIALKDYVTDKQSNRKFHREKSKQPDRTDNSVPLDNQLWMYWTTNTDLRVCQVDKLLALSTSVPKTLVPTETMVE